MDHPAETSLTILYPDAQFPGEPNLEQGVFGPEVQLQIYRAERAGEIPPAVWRECDAIICFDIRIDAATIASFDRCRQIVRAGLVSTRSI
jgi:hypothetical protein